MNRFLIPAILIIAAIFSTSAKAEDSSLGSWPPLPPKTQAPLSPIAESPTVYQLPAPSEAAPWRDSKYTTVRADLIACIEPGPNPSDTAAITRCGELLVAWGFELSRFAATEAEQQAEQPHGDNSAFSQPPWGTVVVGRQAKKKH